MPAYRTQPYRKQRSRVLQPFENGVEIEWLSVALLIMRQHCFKTTEIRADGNNQTAPRPKTGTIDELFSLRLRNDKASMMGRQRQIS